VNNAIGVLVLDHIPLGVDRVAAPGSHCAHVATARAGHARWASGDDITCPLARFNLGLDPPDAATIERLCATLIEWDYAEDSAVARLFVSGLVPLPHGDPILVYGPRDRLPREPDVTIHILSPEGAMHHLIDQARRSGVRALGDISGLGAVCGECTAFPLHSARACVSVGCLGSRGTLSLEPCHLLLAVPAALQQDLALDVG
jgi:uncharacterized protein (DUF169 family)